MSQPSSHRRVRVRRLQDLHRGDQIEAGTHPGQGPPGIIHQGRVLDVAPGLGAVWIRDRSGRRALLHTDEYRLWQVLPADAPGTDLAAEL